MPLGYDTEKRVVYLNDTAELNAYLFDPEDAPLGSDEFDSVVFTLHRPDGNWDEGLQGEIKDDGAGYLAYNTTDLTGEYVAIATFTMVNGAKRSTRVDFQVDDPFRSDLNTVVDYNEWPDLSTDEERLQWEVDLLASRVWDKMEDLFDSTDGGPWMRDMTMNVFSATKLPDFIDEALFTINVYNPPTAFWIDYFTIPSQVPGPTPRPNPNLTVLVQGTWVATIRHLMRSYTEQPLPQGGQVNYEDRRDYLQRWGTMYQIENQLFDQQVKLWKRQFLGLGTSKLLVANKAGRILPAPLRARNIGRGYW